MQWIIRPHSDEHHDYRGYAGEVAAGVFRPGDEVMALPSGFTSTVTAIENLDGVVDQAFPPMSVTMRLADNIDISRGDMICRPNNRPHVGQDIEAMIVWMTDEPLRPRTKYGIKHTTRSARCMVNEVRYRLDIHTLHREPDAGELGLNEIGRVTLRTTVPLLFDEYRRSRATGSFILLDEATNNTIGVGMILPPTD